MTKSRKFKKRNGKSSKQIHSKSKLLADRVLAISSLQKEIIEKLYAACLIAGKVTNMSSDDKSIPAATMVCREAIVAVQDNMKNVRSLYKETAAVAAYDHSKSEEERAEDINTALTIASENIEKPKVSSENVDKVLELLKKSGASDLDLAIAKDRASDFVAKRKTDENE